MAASFAETIAGHTLELDLTKTGAKKESLATLCTDIFLIVIRMRESDDLGEPAALRKLIVHYLELFKKNCRAMNLDSAVTNDAVYALVALLDETVMSIPGVCRNFWVTNPVQLEMFGDTIAGQEFFHKLERLTAEPERMQEVLEVYYLSLSLGFEGKYKLGNAAERDAIIESLARVLLKAGNRSVAGLSPHGRTRITKDLITRSRKSGLPLWAVGAVCCGLLGVWWWVLHLLTVSSANGVLSVYLFR
jgi:type VI secretion system protein ImpK